MGSKPYQLDLELEELNINYDISIDEEQEQKQYDTVIFKNFDFNLGKFEGELRKNLCKQNKKSGEIYKLLNNANNKNSKKETELWFYLFLAKKARAIILSLGSKDAINYLDEVAEFLLSKVAKTYEDSKSNNFSIKIKSIFRLLYYNEISQCYQGYLSIGYAEKALKVFSPLICHYELLSLYNKAIGLSHHEYRKSREKAIKYYDEIINTFKKMDSNLGYNYEINRSIWEKYVYFPALLQKADVLIKLQRGQESINILEGLSDLLLKNGLDSSVKYKLIQTYMLKAQAYIEAGLIQNATEILKVLYKDHYRHYIVKKRQYRVLFNKFRFLIAKYIIERSKNDEKWKENKQNKIEKALNICKELYKSFKENREVSEQVQAAIYWLEAFVNIDLDGHLKAYQLALKSKSNESDNHLNQFYNILDLVFKNPLKSKNTGTKSTQQQWVPRREELIKSLNNGFKFIYKNLKEENEALIELKKREKKFCSIQLEGYGNKRLSCYYMVKLNRRIAIINSKSGKSFFPKENQFKKIINFTKETINRDFYIQRLRYNTECFDKKLIYCSYWPKLKDKYVCTMLHKWQSYTPSLGSYSNSSRGGGYFIYKVGNEGQIQEGIVIDPGYDFIENFLEYGFSIKDINAILFTHSHIDHSDDFRGLITLFHEMNNRGNSRIDNWKLRKVLIVCPPCCFDLFYQTLYDSRNYIRDVIVVDPDRCNDNHVCVIDLLKHFTIRAVPAYHEDLQDDANCVGYIIETKRDKNVIMGFSGDSVWTNELASKLKECPSVTLNMGALLDIRKDQNFERNLFDKENIKKLMYDQNHLYLPGVITLLDQLKQTKKTRIVIIGELGEELKSGLRKDLFYQFNSFIKNHNQNINNNKPLVVIEDIGLTITLDSNNPAIICARCKNPIIKGRVYLKVSEDVRKDEQLNYYCEDCIKVLEALEKGDEIDWQIRY